MFKFGIEVSTSLRNSKIFVYAHSFPQKPPKMQVDEEGTTAAAATMFLPVGSAFIKEEPKEFIADHPFIFILTKDKNPLFMGQFV